MSAVERGFGRPNQPSRAQNASFLRSPSVAQRTPSSLLLFIYLIPSFPPPPPPGGLWRCVLYPPAFPRGPLPSTQLPPRRTARRRCASLPPAAVPRLLPRHAQKNILTEAIAGRTARHIVHTGGRKEMTGYGGDNSLASFSRPGDQPQQQQAPSVGRKYGGMAPKKPLISKDTRRAFFDSADWALGMQGAGDTQKARTDVESLRPKLQRTPHQQLPPRRPTCASGKEEIADD